MKALGQRVQQMLPPQLLRKKGEVIVTTTYDVMQDDVPAPSDKPEEQPAAVDAAPAAEPAAEPPAAAASKRLTLGGLKSSVKGSIPFLSRQQPRSDAATDPSSAPAPAQPAKRVALGCFGDVIHSRSGGAPAVPRAAADRRRQILNKLSQRAKPTPAHTSQQPAANKEERDALHAAAWRGDLARCQQLLAEGALATPLDQVGVWGGGGRGGGE